MLCFYISCVLAMKVQKCKLSSMTILANNVFSNSNSTSGNWTILALYPVNVHCSYSIWFPIPLSAFSIKLCYIHWILLILLIHLSTPLKWLNYHCSLWCNCWELIQLSSSLLFHVIQSIQFPFSSWALQQWNPSDVLSWSAMGTFAGHVLTGSCFILFSLWSTIKQFIRFYKSHYSKNTVPYQEDLNLRTKLLNIIKNWFT